MARLGDTLLSAADDDDNDDDDDYCSQQLLPISSQTRNTSIRLELLWPPCLWIYRHFQKR